jgi:hypothetical protein
MKRSGRVLVFSRAPGIRICIASMVEHGGRMQLCSLFWAAAVGEMRYLICPNNVGGSRPMAGPLYAGPMSESAVRDALELRVGLVSTASASPSKGGSPAPTPTPSPAALVLGQSHLSFDLSPPRRFRHCQPRPTNDVGTMKDPQAIKPRRPHNKSRLGCAQCKLRKVKV